MLELLTDPDGYMEEVSKFGRTGQALLVLAAVGVAYSLQGIVLATLLGEQLGSYSAGVMGSAFSNFFQPLIVWVLFVVCIWAVGSVLGGRPSLGRLVKTVAWAMVPLIGTGVAWALGRFIALQDAPLPEDPSFPGFIEETEQLQPYLAEAAGDPIYLAFRLVGVAFVLLSFYLMVYAAKAASDMDVKKAAISVAPVVVFYFLVAIGLITF